MAETGSVDEQHDLSIDEALENLRRTLAVVEEAVGKQFFRVELNINISVDGVPMEDSGDETGEEGEPQ